MSFFYKFTNYILFKLRLLDVSLDGEHFWILFLQQASNLSQVYSVMILVWRCSLKKF
jgi:hypothetical protein